ncbi:MULTISPECIES: hypothetical protein [unclassified Salinibacterium]|uniref:hypothetical protein n=1 Tax=unclassified Salinibacterium TaxID=2632331 RepID=UPI0014246D77|nr:MULTISPECIES: hypothetical protein [unclassified Salinibacterium]
MTLPALMPLAIMASAAVDDDDVTPGPEGFLLTALVVALVVLLMLDMVRRIRRTTYRAQIRERLAAEEQDRQSGVDDADDGTDTTDPADADATPTDEPPTPTR